MITSAMAALAWSILKGPSDQAESAGRVLAQSVLDALGAEGRGHPSSAVDQ